LPTRSMVPYRSRVPKPQNVTDVAVEACGTKVARRLLILTPRTACLLVSNICSRILDNRSGAIGGAPEQ
jgi:hypothetical protein